MSYESINVPRKYRVIICAVLFGCDDSMVGLDLGKGVKITRKSLHPKDHLNDIFEADSMGLRHEYESAILDSDTLDVACIYGEYDCYLDNESESIYYDRLSSELYTYLDNQIRLIRFLIEGPIRYKKLVIKMVSENYTLDKTNMSYAFRAIIPVGEAYNVVTIQKTHCDDVINLRGEMDNISFPLCQIDYLNQAHILYDRSYLVTLQEAEILLITSLEVLFLKSETAKKQRLSKRCSTFLFETQQERVDTYKKLCLEYKKRSDYIHDGKSLQISEDGIIFLRECVRFSIIKLLKTPKSKNDLINELRIEIESLDYWK